MSAWKFINLSSVEGVRGLIKLVEYNGVNESTEIYSARYCAADLAIPGFNYPAKVPSQGTPPNRSYWKTICVEVKDWPQLCGVLGCSELKDLCIFPKYESVFGPCNLVADWWELSKDAMGGVIIGQRDDGENGMPREFYTPSSGILGETGHPIETFHPYYSSQAKPIRKLDCFTEKKPCIIDKTVQRGPFQSKAMVTQCVIPSTAIYGEKPQISFDLGVKVKP